MGFFRDLFRVPQHVSSREADLSTFVEQGHHIIRSARLGELDRLEDAYLAAKKPLPMILRAHIARRIILPLTENANDNG